MTGVLKGIEIWPKHIQGAGCSWQEHCMINYDSNWCTMVLKWLGSWKEGAEYTFCNDVTNIRDTGLIFWHNMGTCNGHLWYLYCGSYGTFGVFWLESWKKPLSTLFVITSLILGLQDWNFGIIWAPMVVTSGMHFSTLPPLLWELLPFLCVFENVPNLLIDGHNGLAGAQ